jgi:hypothetical protein
MIITRTTTTKKTDPPSGKGNTSCLSAFYQGFPVFEVKLKHQLFSSLEPANF